MAQVLTLLHSERPKLHTILANLSANVLNNRASTLLFDDKFEVRLPFIVSHLCTGRKMLIFGDMLVSWALNSFCFLIFRKPFLLLSEHVSGK